MNIVAQDASWKYRYKKNHYYTDTTNELTRKYEYNLYCLRSPLQEVDERTEAKKESMKITKWSSSLAKSFSFQNLTLWDSRLARGKSNITSADE